MIPRMARPRLSFILASILLAALCTSVVPAQKRAALDEKQQEKFLARRLPSGVITGTFSAFGSFLYDSRTDYWTSAKPAAPKPFQWAFVKNGHAVVIVSTLPTDDTKLLADVESMIKTFRLTP